MAIELAKSVSEELTTMQAELKKFAEDNNRDFHADCAYYGADVVVCRVQRGRVRGKSTFVTSWFVNGKYFGFNGMMGALRRAGVL